MKVTPLDIPEVLLLEGRVHTDDRGEFSRLFCTEDFEVVGLNTMWVQQNRSTTRRRGALRGMHFQYPPHAEIKLVHCIHGAVFDVLVDVRSGSPTYGQSCSTVLSADKHCSVYVPPGFAHGFQALTDDVLLVYMHSTAYAPSAEGGLRYDDPDVGIDWPLKVIDVSARDQDFPRLSNLKSVDL